MYMLEHMLMNSRQRQHVLPFLQNKKAVTQNFCKIHRKTGLTFSIKLLAGGLQIY